MQIDGNSLDEDKYGSDRWTNRKSNKWTPHAKSTTYFLNPSFFDLTEILSVINFYLFKLFILTKLINFLLRFLQ